MVFGGRKAYRKLSRIVDEINLFDTQLASAVYMFWKLIINDGSTKRLYVLIANDNPSISSKRSILVFSASLLQIDYYGSIRIFMTVLFVLQHYFSYFSRNISIKIS